MGDKKKISPRNVPERDSKYMALAWIVAGFSKDPNTQCGAIIIDSKNNPLGWGYNGPPRLIDDNSFSWGRPEKYDKIIHAEINALRHAVDDVSGTTLYVTGMPCKRCMLHIIESEIERVVYTIFESDHDSLLHNQEEKEATLDLVRLSGIGLDKFNGNIYWLLDWIDKLKEVGVFELQ